MAEEHDRPAWGRARRFEFIEWRLFWEGSLNRSDLETTFGISTPQASLDLRHYREAATDNIEYDATRKEYVPSAGMTPQFLRVSAARLLLQLRAWLTGALRREDLWYREPPPVDMVPDLSRNIDAACLRKLLRAIQERRAVDVHYQSLTNSRWRTIAPHALAFDGFRWHVRAWATDHGDFRDFVISRMDKIGESRTVSYDPDDDLEWHTYVDLELIAHPSLNDDQRRAIERDYDMTEGRRTMTVRLALVYYFVKRLNLDLEGLDPTRSQICIVNLEEVERLRREVRSRQSRRAEEVAV